MTNGPSAPSTAVSMEGQILEMLSGICDGRDVVGNSGTYTLQSVTNAFYLTTTYQDLTGSEISYKPPVGWICNILI